MGAPIIWRHEKEKDVEKESRFEKVGPVASLLILWLFKSLIRILFDWWKLLSIMTDRLRDEWTSRCLENRTRDARLRPSCWSQIWLSRLRGRDGVGWPSIRFLLPRHMVDAVAIAQVFRPELHQHAWYHPCNTVPNAWITPRRLRARSFEKAIMYGYYWQFTAILNHH